MAAPLIAGLDAHELRRLHGSFDLGFNATGVIQSKVHFTGDEVIIEETMPGVFVDQIIESVAALRDSIKKRRPGGHLVGQIPTPLYYVWRKEWEKGPRAHGVVWRAYLTSKLMDRDFSKFKAGNL